MGLDLDTIRRLIDQCDPQRPLLKSSPLYIPLDKDPPVRGERACIDQMQRTILHARERSCQLFTGFPGTGKTTELHRLAARFTEAQAPNHGYVVFVDFDEYINRFQPISLSDVLRTLTYCLAREADRVDGVSSPGEAYLERFYAGIQKALPKDAALKSASFGLYGATLMLELRNNPSIHREIERGIAARFQHFAAECGAVMRESIRRIKAKIGSRADRFIVIADGLEKLDAIDHEGRDQIEGAAESLFVAHSDFLRLECHVIYTFPVWLRFRTAQLGASYSAEPLTLPMIKVAERDGGDYDAGLDKLDLLISKRLEDPSRVFGPDPKGALRPLLRASGGYPRDALRMVRSVLQKEDEFPVSAEVVEREIRNLRQSYHAMVLGTHADLLGKIAESHALPNESPESLRAFGELFSRFLVLAYRNGEEWFALHPLVRKAPALRRHFGEQECP